MCGRYTLTFEQVQELEEFLDAWDREKGDRTTPYGNYNVAPTHQMPVSFLEEGRKIIENMHWGFMGWKPKPGQKPFLPINARDDSFGNKPMWTRALSKRCIIPISGFYEWKGPKGNKTPYYIYPTDGKFMAAAGVYSSLSPVEGMKSYSVITTSPNSLMESIHNRMPAFLHPSEFEAWLNPDADTKLLLDMLNPYPVDVMDAMWFQKQ